MGKRTNDPASRNDGAGPMSGRGQSSTMRAFWTFAYRVAYAGLQVIWFFRGQRPAGAFVALWFQNRILLVQTSYQQNRTLPGGGKNRRETDLEAACREVREEVGLTLDPATLTRVDQDVDEGRFARERIALFEAHFAEAPLVRIDHREIVSADWFDVTHPETEKLWPLFRAYIQFKRDSSPS
ncbi:MAG: NUDIX hydrolase [Kiritimatiellae bacterium]|nr:NUDIX hydrolase [Kiritimatiellia bacterium]